ncbi:Putative ankyrin repeat-containing domain superfamily [Colletotrichum destructivum]|uniref:Ankyrin repeat-containing domain superfamily n=1 Tax=Colletotrichum destructivum TaxID=34406 RepID=A0AAX4I129_9PEZI|nr:Putative ankyrin repeat-containing domain superfamily [Colletotrichum destructivum]
MRAICCFLNKRFDDGQTFKYHAVMMRCFLALLQHPERTWLTDCLVMIIRFARRWTKASPHAMEHLDQHSSDLLIDSNPYSLDFEETIASSDSWSSGVNTPSSSGNSLTERGVIPTQDVPMDELSYQEYEYPDPSESPSAWRALDGSSETTDLTLASSGDWHRYQEQQEADRTDLNDFIFHVLVRTPERLFRREVSTDAWHQHQLDCGRKTQALRHAITSSTNLFLRGSIGDTILHTLAGDFGLPNLSAETEGYDILQRLFDIGPDGFGSSVKSCCLSMIDSQNDGYRMIDGAPAEPFMHTPLGVAILYNNLACAELLLQHGAGANIPGEWGQRPLFFAYRNNSEEAVKLLTAYGACL